MFAYRKKSDLKRFFDRHLASGSHELNNSDHQNEPPIFSTTMQVDQVYTGHYPFWKVALHLLLGFVPGLLALSFVNGKSETLLAVVFWILSNLIAIGLLSFRLIEHLQRETKKLFHGETQVTLKANGIKINHIGQASWQEILSIDTVSRTNEIVSLSILSLGRLQLRIPPSRFKKIATPYFEASLRNTEEIANRADGVLQFKGAIFNWPIFFTVFILGCIAGVVAAINIFEAARGFEATVFCTLLLGPMAATAVWAIPFLQLQQKQYSKPKLFSLEGFALRDSDDKVISLRDSKIVAHREVVTLVYSLTFLSIYPKAGKRIDLWINEPEIRFVVRKLNKLGFELTLPPEKYWYSS